MNIGWFITQALSSLLLPPMSLLLIAVFGAFVVRRRPRIGATLMALSGVLLLALSTAAGSRWLAEPLERQSLPIADPARSDAQAIVVLGGGRQYDAPEDEGRDQPSLSTLARLRHAARLARLTKLPVLVSGGKPEGNGESEAAVMARVLREDFGVRVHWLEQASDNTAENALHASLQLDKEGVRRILLVSDAMHMPRAVRAFTAAGFDVVPAPTNFRARRPLDVASFVPRASELETSSYAIHEWIGLLWYRVRYGIGIG